MPNAPWYKTYKACFDDIGRYLDKRCFPVQIGTQLDRGRYIVSHKLGSGATSNTWLAEDPLMKSYVAIKLLRTETSSLQTHTEFDILQHVQKYTSRPGSQYIRQCFGQFKESWDGVQYDALVLEPTGQSLASKIYHEGISFPTAKQSIREVVYALQHLHEDCHVTHGDIYAGNVTLASPTLKDLDEEQLLKVLGPIVQEPVTRADGGELLDAWIPKYTVRDAKFGIDGPIKLIDFAGSWHFGMRPEDAAVKIRPSLRPPELLESTWQPEDNKFDMWMLGCMMYEVFVGGTLYEDTDDKQLLRQIYDINEEVLRARITEEATETDIPVEDHNPLVRILGGLLEKDPAKRLSALDLAQDKWFR